MKDIKNWLGVGVAIVSIAGAAGSWVALPNRVGALEVRVDKAEQRVDKAELKVDSQRDLLVRIDERVRAIQVKLNIQTPP